MDDTLTVYLLVSLLHLELVKHEALSVVSGGSFFDGSAGSCWPGKWRLGFPQGPSAK